MDLQMPYRMHSAKTMKDKMDMIIDILLASSNPASISPQQKPASIQIANHANATSEDHENRLISSAIVEITKLKSSIDDSSQEDLNRLKKYKEDESRYVRQVNGISSLLQILKREKSLINEFVSNKSGLIAISLIMKSTIHKEMTYFKNPLIIGLPEKEEMISEYSLAFICFLSISRRLNVVISLCNDVIFKSMVEILEYHRIHIRIQQYGLSIFRNMLQIDDTNKHFGKKAAKDDMKKRKSIIQSRILSPIISNNGISIVISAMRRFQHCNVIQRNGLSFWRHLILITDASYIIELNHKYDMELIPCILNALVNHQKDLLIQKRGYFIIHRIFKMLSNQNRVDEIREQVAILTQNVGSIKSMMNAMKIFIDDVHIQRNCLSILYYLSFEENERTRGKTYQFFTSINGPLVLVSMKSHISDRFIQRLGCSLFVQLFTLDSLSKAILLDHNGIKFLINSIMTYPDDIFIIKLSFLAIWQIMSHFIKENNQNRISSFVTSDTFLIRSLLISMETFQKDHDIARISFGLIKTIIYFCDQSTREELLNFALSKSMVMICKQHEKDPSIQYMLCTIINPLIDAMKIERIPKVQSDLYLFAAQHILNLLKIYSKNPRLCKISFKTAKSILTVYEKSAMRLQNLKPILFSEQFLKPIFEVMNNFNTWEGTVMQMYGLDIIGSLLRIDIEVFSKSDVVAKLIFPMLLKQYDTCMKSQTPKIDMLEILISIITKLILSMNDVLAKCSVIENIRYDFVQSLEIFKKNATIQTCILGTINIILQDMEINRLPKGTLYEYFISELSRFIVTIIKHFVDNIDIEENACSILKIIIQDINKRRKFNADELFDAIFKVMEEYQTNLKIQKAATRIICCMSIIETNKDLLLGKKYADIQQICLSKAVHSYENDQEILESTAATWFGLYFSEDGFDIGSINALTKAGYMFQLLVKIVKKALFTSHVGSSSNRMHATDYMSKIKVFQLSSVGFKNAVSNPENFGSLRSLGVHGLIIHIMKVFYLDEMIQTNGCCFFEKFLHVTDNEIIIDELMALDFPSVIASAINKYPNINILQKSAFKVMYYISEKTETESILCSHDIVQSIITALRTNLDNEIQANCCLILLFISQHLPQILMDQNTFKCFHDTTQRHLNNKSIVQNITGTIYLVSGCVKEARDKLQLLIFGLECKITPLLISVMQSYQHDAIIQEYCTGTFRFLFNANRTHLESKPMIENNFLSPNIRLVENGAFLVCASNKNQYIYNKGLQEILNSMSNFQANAAIIRNCCSILADISSTIKTDESHVTIATLRDSATLSYLELCLTLHFHDDFIKAKASEAITNIQASFDTRAANVMYTENQFGLRMSMQSSFSSAIPNQYHYQQQDLYQSSSMQPSSSPSSFRRNF